MERLFPIEYLAIQLDFARRAAELTGVGLYTALHIQTSYVRMANKNHSILNTHPLMLRIQGVLPTTGYKYPLDELYQLYTEYAQTPFPKEDRLISGHFQLSLPDKENLCHIHFESKTGSRPLHSDNLDQRRQELIQLFRMLKENEHAKGVKIIGGFSWLYNLRAYCSLFPPDYIASGKEKAWYGSLARWGQFLKNDYTIREDVASEFRYKINNAQTFDDLKTSFRYSVLETRSPVESFYNFYQIHDKI